MKKLLLALALLNISAAHATTVSQYNKEHLQKKQQLFASLDYCSNLGSQEVFNLGTQSLSEIKKDLENIKKSFKELKQQKTNCFDNSEDFLNDIIADNFIFIEQNPENPLLELQNKVDQKLADTITLRKKININLIASILNDIEKSIKETKQAAMNDTFIKESSKTKKLITQELNVIYDSMEAQLKLDQSNLDLIDKDKLEITKIANVTLRGAFLNLSRALLLFENIEQEPRTYNIAKIRTFLGDAHNKLLELKAFSKNLEGLDSKKDINKIISQMSIIKVDLDITIKDLADENFSEDFLNWAGQIYQQTSALVTEVQKVLDTVYLIDITESAMPIDITIREEFLDFDPVQPIQHFEPLPQKKEKVANKKKASEKIKDNKEDKNKELT